MRGMSWIMTERLQLLSIEEARRELGGISRTTLYVTVLPKLEELAQDRDGKGATVKLGRRRLILRQYLDEFLLSLRHAWWFLMPITILHVHSWGWLGVCHGVLCPGVV